MTFAPKRLREQRAQNENVRHVVNVHEVIARLRQRQRKHEGGDQNEREYW